jgi:hypothetical protein
VELGEHFENDERKAHMSDQALLETESKRAKDASLREKHNSTVPLLHLVKLLLRLVYVPVHFNVLTANNAVKVSCSNYCMI